MLRARVGRAAVIALICEGLVAIADVSVGSSNATAPIRGHDVGQALKHRAALPATVPRHGPKDAHSKISHVIDAQGDAHVFEAEPVHQAPLVRTSERPTPLSAAERPSPSSVADPALFSSLATSESDGSARQATGVSDSGRPSVGYFILQGLALVCVVGLLGTTFVAGAGGACCPSNRFLRPGGEPPAQRLSWEERASRFSRVERGSIGSLSTSGSVT